MTRIVITTRFDGSWSSRRSNLSERDTHSVCREPSLWAPDLPPGQAWIGKITDRLIAYIKPSIPSGESMRPDLTRAWDTGI